MTCVGLLMHILNKLNNNNSPALARVTSHRGWYPAGPRFPAIFEFLAPTVRGHKTDVMRREIVMGLNGDVICSLTMNEVGTHAYVRRYLPAFVEG